MDFFLESSDGRCVINQGGAKGPGLADHAAIFGYCSIAILTSPNPLKATSPRPFT